jgi:hypothetical protein
MAAVLRPPAWLGDIIWHSLGLILHCEELSEGDVHVQVVALALQSCRKVQVVAKRSC